MSGRFQEKFDETPRGLEQARQDGLALIKAARLRAGPHAKLILGGFSQGSMLAIDLALSLEPDSGADALFILSGFPMCLSRWKQLAALHVSKTKVVQAHGLNDPLLPFMTSALVRQVFEDAGVKVVFVQHNGAHDLGDDTVIQKLAEFYSQVVAS